MQAEGDAGISEGSTPAAGVVEFRAHWSDTSGRTGVLHEVSRFEKRAGRWVYVDGNVK